LRTAYPTICGPGAADRALLPGRRLLRESSTPDSIAYTSDGNGRLVPLEISPFNEVPQPDVRNGRHVPRAVVAVERPPVLAVQHGIVNQRAIWIDPAELPVRRAGLTPYPIAEPVQASKRVAERFRFPLEPTQALLARARRRTLAIHLSRIAAPDGRWDVSGVAMGYLWG